MIISDIENLRQAGFPRFLANLLRRHMAKRRQRICYDQLRHMSEAKLRDFGISLDDLSGAYDVEHLKRPNEDWMRSFPL
jgi:uncharacterized protein YjiS (DUF1127 family)